MCLPLSQLGPLVSGTSRTAAVLVSDALAGAAIAVRPARTAAAVAMVFFRVRIIFLAFPVGVVGDVPSEKVRVVMQGRFDGPPQYHCCERGNRLVVIRARAGPGQGSALERFLGGQWPLRGPEK